MARSISLKTSLALVFLALCLVWMDACLYFQIQSIDDDQTSAGLSYNIDKLAHYHDQDNTMRKQPVPPTNLSLDELTSHRHVVVLPLMDKFSFAFRGMSVKLMMTDPVDNYLLAPLSETFADMINLRDNFTFISANMVSYAGVVSALVAAKLVSYDSLTLHRLSYAMFQVRTWLDDLDGAVARARMGINKHVSLKNTSGYVVDGVCDAIGFVAYIVGCYIFMRGTIRRRRDLNRLAAAGGSRSGRSYSLQSITEIKTSNRQQNRRSTKDYIPLECDGPPSADRSASDNDLYDEHSEPRSAEEDFELTNNDEEEEDDDDDDDEETILHCTSALNQVKINTDNLAEKTEKPKFFSRINLVKHILPKTSRILWKGDRAGSGRMIFYRYIKEKLRRNLNNRHLILLFCCFLLQLAMCSMFWNRYILIYQDLLESPSASELQHKLKRKVLKSNLMYVIIWFWRLTNGHTFMQMLITAVFFGKLWQFLEFIKYIGFIEIIGIALVTELHVIDVANLVNVVA